MYHLAKLIVTTFMSRNISVSALHFELGRHIYVGSPKGINKLSPERYRLERILTMVYVVQNSQNFYGHFPSSYIPKNTTFRKLDLFPSSGEGGGEDTYSVGPLRKS
jgi:hypothetical protein